MASLTVFAANSVLDGTPIPAGLYVDLHVGDPTDTGLVDLAAGTSRELVSRGAAAAGVAFSTNQQAWIPYSANETISHVSLWDDADAGEGNCWFVGALLVPKVVAINDAVYFQIGSISFEMETY